MGEEEALGAALGEEQIMRMRTFDLPPETVDTRVYGVTMACLSCSQMVWNDLRTIGVLPFAHERFLEAHATCRNPNSLRLPAVFLSLQKKRQATILKNRLRKQREQREQIV